MTQQPDVLALPGQPLSSAGSFVPGYGTHVHAGQICASLAGRVHRVSTNLKDGKIKSQKSQTATKPTIYVLPLGSKLPAPLTTATAAPVAAAPVVQAPPRQPDITSGVLARVTRITPRHAQVDIVCLSPPTPTSSASTSTTTTTTTTPPSTNSSTPSLPPASQDYIPLSSPYPTGLIRAQDIRATPLDTISTPGGSIGSSNITGSAHSNNSSSSRSIILSAFRIGDIVRAVVISMGDQQHYYLSTATDELGVVLAVSAGGGSSGSSGVGMQKAKGGNLMYPVSWREMRDPMTGSTESRKVARPF